MAALNRCCVISPLCNSPLLGAAASPAASLSMVVSWSIVMSTNNKTVDKCFYLSGLLSKGL